jgi:hypothetical protein
MARERFVDRRSPTSVVRRVRRPEATATAAGGDTTPLRLFAAGVFAKVSARSTSGASTTTG